MPNTIEQIGETWHANCPGCDRNLSFKSAQVGKPSRGSCPSCELQFFSFGNAELFKRPYSTDWIERKLRNAEQLKEVGGFDEIVFTELSIALEQLVKGLFFAFLYRQTTYVADAEESRKFREWVDVLHSHGCLSDEAHRSLHHIYKCRNELHHAQASSGFESLPANSLQILIADLYWYFLPVRVLPKRRRRVPAQNIFNPLLSQEEEVK